MKQDDDKRDGNRKVDALVGKLVVVSHWPDFDPQDGFYTGYLERIDDDGYFYLDGVKRGFRFCRKVGTKTYKRSNDRDETR